MSTGSWDILVTDRHTHRHTDAGKNIISCLKAGWDKYMYTQRVRNVNMNETTTCDAFISQSLKLWQIWNKFIVRCTVNMTTCQTVVLPILHLY